MDKEIAYFLGYFAGGSAFLATVMYIHYQVETLYHRKKGKFLDDKVKE